MAVALAGWFFELRRRGQVGVSRGLPLPSNLAGPGLPPPCHGSAVTWLGPAEGGSGPAGGELPRAGYTGLVGRWGLETLVARRRFHLSGLSSIIMYHG